jgi:hypothetical protein
VYRISPAFLSTKKTSSSHRIHNSHTAKMNTFEEENRRLQLIGAMAATTFILLEGKKYVIEGRTGNRCNEA